VRELQVRRRNPSRWNARNPSPGRLRDLDGPGTTVSHDALRILASQGTALLAIGEGGFRIYSAPPLIPGSSDIARAHAYLWSNENESENIVRRMFGWRFGEVFPHKRLDILRGMEGARVRKLYEIEANKAGISWAGRKYDRSNPAASDLPNQAINHATTCAYAAAAIAVYSVGAIPQLGFIHEAAGDAFCLDIADLYRMSFTVPIAFRSVKLVEKSPHLVLERVVRKEMGRSLSEKNLIDDMIRKIKELFDVNDSLRNP
jgi:CRISPR-associated protein Cas1